MTAPTCPASTARAWRASSCNPARSDWPLNELDRFKARRPHIYAQMKTRLMAVTPAGQAPPTGQDCARLKALKVEGKVQGLPRECAGPAAKKGAAAAAVAKQGGN